MYGQIYTYSAFSIGLIYINLQTVELCNVTIQINSGATAGVLINYTVDTKDNGSDSNVALLPLSYLFSIDGKPSLAV